MKLATAARGAARTADILSRSATSRSGRPASRGSTARPTRRSWTTSATSNRDRPFALVSASVDDEGVHVISAVSDSLKDRVKAPEIMKRLGLRGGGRPDFAQGGGVDAGETSTTCGGRRVRDVELTRRCMPRGARRRRRLRARDRSAGDASRRAVAARPRSSCAALRAPASAQIYTRRTRTAWSRPPTSPPPRDFRLTYPGKGTLIHSRGFRLRRSTTASSTTTSRPRAALHSVSARPRAGGDPGRVRVRPPGASPPRARRG